MVDLIWKSDFFADMIRRVYLFHFYLDAFVHCSTMANFALAELSEDFRLAPSNLTSISPNPQCLSAICEI
jgi:hypothetical protein